MNNAGAALAALRKKVTKTCPICQVVFEGYPSINHGCPKHYQTVNSRLRAAKKKLEKTNELK